MKMLSISPVAPYDNIGHAGGKTYNYYLKGLSSYCDVSALLFCPMGEKDRIDLDDYGIPYTTIFTSGNLLVNAMHFFLDSLGYLYYGNKMYSLYKYIKIIRHLDLLKRKNRLPDVIELEWTNFVYYAKKIHQRYPSVKLVASEHDVNFQAFFRKGVRGNAFSRLKKQEIDSLKCCDAITVPSDKDMDLLVKEGLSPSKIMVITPYFHNMSTILRNPNKRDILFWGAMYRPENYEAAIWFVDNVMPLLADRNVRFIIAGNRPPKELKQLEKENIIVTGFVEDEKALFQSSMCFVAPLLTGAGIKVKVVEALSARIPVITNDIGIEGIGAVDGKEYFHCETAEQYAALIMHLQNGEIDENALLINQERFMNTHFNLDDSLRSYAEMIKNI